MTELENENDESAEYFLYFLVEKILWFLFLGNHLPCLDLKAEAQKDESEPLYILVGLSCLFFFKNMGNWMSLRAECRNAYLVWI